MKKLKGIGGYETVLAAQYGTTGGCEAVLDPSASETMKRDTAGYVDKGRNLLLFVLMAGVIAKVFYSVEISSFAQTSHAAKQYEGSRAFYEAEDSIPEYREYAAGFDAVYPKREICIEAGDCVRYEEHGRITEPVIYQDYEGMPGSSLYTGADAVTGFAVRIEEEGFYNLLLSYYPLAGSESAIERSILVDGETPYREMARVEYDRIWTVAAGKGGTYAAEQISGTDRDIEKRNDYYAAKPLTVYLTRGEHTITFVSRKEPMMIHQVILGCAKPAQEYKKVKGFWDAVGIRAAEGEPVCMEAEQMSVSAKGPSDTTDDGVTGIFWEQAGQWVEWAFDVKAAGYYTISMRVCQNYVKGGDTYRKIMVDGIVPFQEMERYGFRYGWFRRTDVLSDTVGVPYVFYLKEGRHTFRMEAVCDEASGYVRTQPLTIERIEVAPAKS